MMKRPIAILAAICAALSAQVVSAEEPDGFYAGAGAGFTAAPPVVMPEARAADTTAAFGGYRFNSRLGVEGFYADIDADLLPMDTSGNLYTYSLSGSGIDGDTTVAGFSAVARFSDRGRVRPFARAGVHYYRFGGALETDSNGDSLLLGAGADVDLSRHWRARLEWERYADVDNLDRDIFSARFDYQF